MAPKKAEKRGAAPASAPAAKKAKQDPKPKADPNVTGVVNALERATDLPESCRQMLLACVPHCFGLPSEERHACQEETVRIIEEVIKGVEATLQSAANDEVAKVADVEASKDGLQQALAEAEAAVASAKEEVGTKTTVLAEAAKVVQAAKASAQEAEEAQRAGDAKLLEDKQSKAALEKGIESDLAAILEGQGELQQHFQALLPLLSGLGLDESLMSALPSSCKKPAADRGSFDSMVLEQLGARLREQVAALTKAVEEATPAAEERASAVESAQAELSKATEARKQAVEELERAQEGQRAAAAGESAAAEKLAAFGPEYASATKARDETAAELENFRGYNIACFEHLKAPAAKVADGGA